jgi:hypothetical protein
MNVYQFKWKVYHPEFRGCANDGTYNVSAECFDKAYQKFLTKLKPWFEEAGKGRIDFEVFSAVRILDNVR